MVNRSAGRNLRLITLGPGTWGWVIATLMLLALIVLMAKSRLFG